jgi:positive regulator of sigma E activity
MRALYFAPYGEMGLPQRFSGSVIAMASFIVYLPSSFAYLLWALILDGNPGVHGYALMFFALSIVSAVGFVLARALRQRMRSGTADRVAVLVAELDAKLGLQGREKRLSDLINQGRS